MALGSALNRISRRLLLALAGAGVGSVITGGASADAGKAVDERSVLQDLYDSEINFSIVTFWDGGFEVRLGDEVNGFEAEANLRSWREVEFWLTNKAIQLHPYSVFTLIYRDGLSREQAIARNATLHQLLSQTS